MLGCCYSLVFCTTISMYSLSVRENGEALWGRSDLLFGFGGFDTTTQTHTHYLANKVSIIINSPGAIIISCFLERTRRNVRSLVGSRSLTTLRALSVSPLMRPVYWMVVGLSSVLLMGMPGNTHTHFTTYFITSASVTMIMSVLQWSTKCSWWGCLKTYTYASNLATYLVLLQVLLLLHNVSVYVIIMIISTTTSVRVLLTVKPENTHLYTLLGHITHTIIDVFITNTICRHELQ